MGPEMSSSRVNHPPCPPPDCLRDVPLTGSRPHRRDLGDGIEGHCTRGMGLHTGQGHTRPNHLEWLAVTGVRARAELDARVTSQAARAAGGGCGHGAPAGPRLILLVGGSLAGGDICHTCSLEVSGVAGCRGPAGELTGQEAARGCGVRRWRCARAVNHVFIGRGFEGAEEAKVKQ